jgi:arsenate reductase
MSEVTIYHNPRCSKSRATLALLEAEGIAPQIRAYLDEPPTIDELRDVCQMLGIAPIALLRDKEARFKALGLSVEDVRSDDEWLLLMVTNPILIERPIVISAGKAAIGRPPEAVLEILP